MSKPIKSTGGRRTGPAETPAGGVSASSFTPFGGGYVPHLTDAELAHQRAELKRLLQRWRTTDLEDQAETLAALADGPPRVEMRGVF